MIRGLRGTLEEVGPDWAVIGVGGVSLRAFVPTSVLADLGPVGAQVQLHTHLAVREDGIALYGFSSPQALRLFELLLGISGVGPRLALAVLSSLAPEALAMAITAGDAEALGRAPGVGKRTAARIILELKGKLEEEWGMPTTVSEEAGDDVLAALLSLGYSPSEARRATVSLPRDSSLSVEERVRLALQSLARA